MTWEHLGEVFQNLGRLNVWRAPASWIGRSIDRDQIKIFTVTIRVRPRLTRTSWWRTDTKVCSDIENETFKNEHKEFDSQKIFKIAFNHRHTKSLKQHWFETENSSDSVRHLCE
jgi:hypothetical protein